MATTLILGGDLPAPSDVVEAVRRGRTASRCISRSSWPRSSRRSSRGPPDPRGARPGHDRGRGAGPDQPPVRGGAARRAGRRGHRPLLHPRRPRRRRGPAAVRARAIDPGARRRRNPLSLRLHRPGLLRLPAPAAPRCDLRRRSAVAAAKVPRPGGRVRHGLEASSIVHASRHYERGRPAAAGVPGVVDGGARGQPDLGPPGGVRALRAGDRQHAGRTCRSASRPSSTSASRMPLRPSSATRSASRPRRGPGSCTSRPGGRSTRPGCSSGCSSVHPVAASRTPRCGPTSERALDEIAGAAGDPRAGGAPSLPAEHPSREPAVCRSELVAAREDRAGQPASSPTSLGDRETVPRGRPDPRPDRHRRAAVTRAGSATACGPLAKPARPASKASASPATATSRSWLRG